LLFAGSRPLAPEERQELLEQSRRCRRGAWLRIAAIPVGLALIVASGYALPRSDTVAIAVGSIAAIYVLLGTAILLSLALDRFRWARGLRADLAPGTVHAFEGDPSSLPPFEPTVRALRRKGRLLPDPARTARLEVLPASSLVWRIDGARPPAWIKALVARVARTPAAASVAARWVRPVAVAGGGVAMANQRALSPEEISELRSLVHRNVARLVLMSLLAAFLVAQAAFRWRELGGAIPFFITAGAVFIVLRLAREIQARWRFRRDAVAGRVVIVQSDPVPGPDGEPTPGPTIEFLPVSRIPWTRNGEAYAWRALNAFEAKELIPPARRDAP